MALATHPGFSSHDADKRRHSSKQLFIKRDGGNFNEGFTVAGKTRVHRHVKMSRYPNCRHRDGIAYEGTSMLLMSKLKQAARECACISFTYGGGDASELIALITHIATLEHCTMDHHVAQGVPGTITVQFLRE